MGVTMEAVYLGYDLGTKRSKGILISAGGAVLHRCVREHATMNPGPGRQEQNPADWWEEFREITRELLLFMPRQGVPDSTAGPADTAAAAPVSPLPAGAISGIGITGFVPVLTLLDQKGTPLRPAILHTDTRAAGELPRLRDDYGLELSLGTLLPKLLWVRRNEAEIFSRISTVMSAHSYLAYRLSGSPGTDYDTAAIFGDIFDISASRYRKDVLHSLDLSPDLFPPPFPADSIIGRVSAAASEETGIPAGTPVIAGTGDSFASLLGDGAVQKGDMMVYLGTSGTEILVEGDAGGFIDTPHFGEGKAQFVGRIFSCGESLETVRNICGGTPWYKLNSEAEQVPPGSEGLMLFPHLKQKPGAESSLNDNDIIIGLHAGHTRAHLFRAVLEGVAARVRERYDTRRDDIMRVICTGGGAESSLLRRILADMLQMPVEYHHEGSACLGIALLAAVAIENIEDPAAFIISRLSKPIRTVPETGTGKAYEQYFADFTAYQHTLIRSSL